MENKLELKHLAAYLPYGLKVCYRVLDLENGNPNTDNTNDRMMNCIMVMDGARLDRCLLNETDKWYDKNSVFKPILRPLSDLTEVHANNCGYVELEFLKIDIKYQKAPYLIFTDLLNNHWDVFGLIDKGLAIDINSIQELNKPH